MDINTNSWHFKLYDWTYMFGDTPDRTNLCQYMRRLFFSPFWLLRNLFCYFVIYGIIGFIHLWFGKYPTFIGIRSYGKDFKEYKLPEINGQRILPIYGLIPISIVVLMYEAIVWHSSFAQWILAIVAIFMIVGSLVYVTERFPFHYPSEPGFFSVVKEWVRAKKARFCPTIEFTRDDDN